MIKKSDIRTDLPPITETNGHTNCVLALVKDDFYCPTNTYLSAWQVVNTVWYCKHAEDYAGWVELENILPPEFTPLQIIQHHIKTHAKNCIRRKSNKTAFTFLMKDELGQFCKEQNLDIDELLKEADPIFEQGFKHNSDALWDDKEEASLDDCKKNEDLTDGFDGWKNA